jgi:eukaryotic-like serine/threonine-protein kinase
MSVDSQSIQFAGQRYQVLEILGQGGMGVVYKALDRLTGETIALKQVRVASSDLQFASKNSENDGAMAIAMEFRVLAGLRHPHIVAVLDYGFDAQHFPFYTMQLLRDGKPVTDYGLMLDSAGKVHLLVDMLQAVAYLHRRRIIHRDLKPGNVLVTPDGIVRVMDFGLALPTDQSRSGQG